MVLVLGLLGAALEVLEVGFVAHEAWWTVLIPFALAMVWWAWADWSGYTKRKVVEKENARRQDRIDRQRSNLGMLTSRSSRKVLFAAAQAARRRSRRLAPCRNNDPRPADPVRVFMGWDVLVYGVV